MTHQQVLDQFSKSNDQFAWADYAAADIYISYVCPTINNAAPVCSLPAIKQLEQLKGWHDGRKFGTCATDIPKSGIPDS